MLSTVILESEMVEITRTQKYILLNSRDLKQISAIDKPEMLALQLHVEEFGRVVLLQANCILC